MSRPHNRPSAPCHQPPARPGTTRWVSAALVALGLTCAGLPAMAQNIAIVNGKPVPKARADVLMENFRPGTMVTPDSVILELSNPQLQQALSLREAADRDYGRLLEQTLWARIYRAAYSERGLYERMVEFWTDHLNVPIPDLLVDKIIDDREVVRKHALGRFGDLLRASFARDDPAGGARGRADRRRRPGRPAAGSRGSASRAGRG